MHRVYITREMRAGTTVCVQGPDGADRPLNVDEYRDCEEFLARQLLLRGASLKTPAERAKEAAQHETEKRAAGRKSEESVASESGAKGDLIMQETFTVESTNVKGD